MSQTWIDVGAKGTDKILETKKRLKSARQRNTNNQKDLRRQLSYFQELEIDAGGLEKPSFAMSTTLMKIQKAQELTEHSMASITETVDDLTCLLAEI